MSRSLPSQVLTWGGAYVQFVGSGACAKKKGQDFSDGIIADRYDDFRVHISGMPWCPWFFDIAWDHTWIVTDLRDQRVRHRHALTRGKAPVARGPAGELRCAA